MPANTRVEMLDRFHDAVERGGDLTFSRSEGKKAYQRLEKALRDVQSARRQTLQYEMLWYRVAIFGSARLSENSEEFQFVTGLSKALVESRDVDIVTGGGPGIMEAAHKGVKLAQHEAEENHKKFRPKNYGITISTLPNNEPQNSFIHFVNDHEEFSSRLQAFVDKTDAAIFCAGGYGTDLELAYLRQLKQVGHLETDYPIIIIDRSWWKIHQTRVNELYYKRIALGKMPLISERDLDLAIYESRIPEIVETVSTNYDKWVRDVRSHIKVTK